MKYDFSYSLNKEFTGSPSFGRSGGTTRYAVLLFLGCRFPQDVVPSSEFLQVSTNIDMVEGSGLNIQHAAPSLLC